MSSFFEFAKKIISIDSSVSQGTVEIVDYFNDLARSFGFLTEIQEGLIDGVVQRNIIVSDKLLESKSNVLFVSHLDTVDPGVYSLWDKTEFNPFNASLSGDSIYGLGAATGKIDFLCKLLAMKSLKDNGEPILVTLLGSYGRESGMEGIKRFLQHNKNNFTYALVAEPSSNDFICSSIGLVNIEITIPYADEEMVQLNKSLNSENFETQSRLFQGKVAHPLSPDWDENAIHKMFEYLGQLPKGLLLVDLDGGSHFNIVPERAYIELEVDGCIKESVTERLLGIYDAIKKLQMDFKNHSCEGFEPNYPTINIGRAKKNDNYIRLHGSCRIPPSISETLYSSWIQQIKVTCDEQNATLRIMDYKPSYSLSLENHFVKKSLELVECLPGPLATSKSSRCSEANVLNRRGIEAVAFGAGIAMGNIYEPNECVNIKTLSQSRAIYEVFLRGVCE
ncbi:MAG: M20/M25/M40 family metallo-hydrolase [Bdellovibrionaceae bacterium]|nr:M20/M25/M40 family metallo-hydrolase [Pseudobdellovibrionaceae bacterium]